MNSSAHAMEQKFRETLFKQGMLLPDERVIAAVSGGADSVCMLHLLLEAGFSPSVIHVQHMLRGAEAERDARFVSALCRRLGLECGIIYKDVPALAELKGLSIEEAARILRYEALFESAQKLNIKKIAVAHNINDQAETILLRLIRGSGLAGLAGMQPVRTDGIIRPLMGFTRAEIEQYCSIKGLDYIQDSTNFSEDYSRNYVRGQLIPLMERLNPALCRVLAGSARIMAEDEAYLSGQAAADYKKLAERTETGVILDAEELKKTARPIAARIVRFAVEEVCGLKDITALHIESVLGLLEAQTGKWLPLKRGARACRNYAQLFIGFPQKTEEFCLPFALGEFNAGARRITVSMAERLNARAGEEEYVDFSKVPDGSVLRSRRPGDRIFPLGAPGEKKLKDYLIDKKVPRAQRDKLVLLACSGEVLAVLGMTVSVRACVDENTKNIAVIKVEVNNAGKGC